MSKARILADRALTNTERKQRFDDRAASIDEQFDQALSQIDWKRRNKASKSLINFINTYCIGLMIDEKPSERFVDAAKEMEFALTQTRPYNIELSRGSGKTSLAEMAMLYLLSTGQRKFCVIVSQNARSATNILRDLWRPIVEKDTAYAQDFPEVTLPFQICDGAYRRRQLYRSVSTDIQKNSSVIQFARLQKEDGTEFPTSGSVITVRGITSGVRGLKVGKLRPDTVLLDDLQTAETASSPDQVQKIYEIIKKDIFNLSSKGKLAVIMTSTPLCPDDLCDKIEKDPAWKTTKFPAVIAWPRELNGLWQEYFKIFDAENASDLDHKGSLKFYRDNKKQMDEGAVLFAPKRFKREDGHISGLQAILEKRHTIGVSCFNAEYQMQPTRAAYELRLSSTTVASKINHYRELEVPDGFIFTAGSIDINSSYAITALLMSFKRDLTSVVIWKQTFKCSIDGKLNDTQYNQELFGKLNEVVQTMKGLGVKIDGVAVDAGSRNWNCVCDFAKSCKALPICAFAGRSATQFNPLVRTRLRNASGRTVLCGNPEERIKAGAGQKYVLWDADFYKEAFQRAFLADVGAPGSCSVYDSPVDSVAEFAMQVTNEQLKFKTERRGQQIYTWQTKEPHDYLDCGAMCYAVAAQMGLQAVTAPQVRRFVHVKRPRIKIV